MNTIKIKGTATRRVPADAVSYEIRFYSDDITVSRATEKNIEQCERFLKRMKKLGMDISQMHLSDDKINFNNSRSEVKTVSRAVTFELPFDSRINNAILRIIKEENLTVLVNTEFILSNRKQIHRELLREALIDSREKAEAIASANNQTIKYLEAVSDNHEDIYREEKQTETLYGSVDGLDLENESLSAELSAKYLEESETIYASWVIE